MMNLFENLQLMKEANETDLKNVNFRKITVKEFAEMIDVDSNVISNLMRECSSCSYANKLYEAIVKNVENSKVPEDKRDVVSKFIYENLFNRTLGDVSYK